MLAMVACCVFPGCNLSFEPAAHADDPCDAYGIQIIFKDKSENDLVSLVKDDWTIDHWGLVNPDLYNLEIKKTRPDEWIRRTYSEFGGYSPVFSISKIPNEDEIVSLYNITTLLSWYGWQDKLTYRITCPTIFGDSLSHDIEAFFGKDPYVYRRTILTYPECTKVLFEGKEFPVKSVLYDEKNELATNVVEIVLDR